MRWEVSHFAQETGVEEEQMALVVNSEIGVTADRGYEEASPARHTVVDPRDCVDHAAVEGEEQEVLEAGREVPAGQGLVEYAVAGHRALVLEALGQDGDGGDVLVLDAIAVVPEIGGCLRHRWTD